MYLILKIDPYNGKSWTQLTIEIRIITIGVKYNNFFLMIKQWALDENMSACWTLQF